MEMNADRKTQKNYYKILNCCASKERIQSYMITRITGISYKNSCYSELLNLGYIRSYHLHNDDFSLTDSGRQYLISLQSQKRLKMVIYVNNMFKRFYLRIR